MRISRKILTYILIGTFAVSLVGCSSSKANQNSSINVGMNLNNYPFASKNTNGEKEGFDIDFINYMSQNLTIDFNIVDTPKISLIPNLLKSQTDLVISGMSYDDAMKISDEVITSKSYYQVEDIILINYNSTKKIKSLKDLNNKIVGVKIGSYQEKLVDSLIADKTLTLNSVKRYNKNAEAILGLQNGEIDAVIVDNVYMGGRDFEDITKLADSLSKTDLVVVASKENKDLIDKINVIIDNYKNTKEYKTSISNWIK